MSVTPSASSKLCESGKQTDVLIRCDDFGMCHSVNMAGKRLMENGLTFSVSTMFTCLWYREAIDILKGHPNISVGVHLVLNSDWRNYRWGPVSGRSRVPSLVNEDGYFFHSQTSFLENQPKIDEIERELRAQIERALDSGIPIDYLDHHMGTLAAKPELRRLLMKLGKEHHLGISTYFDENVEDVYFVPYKLKGMGLVHIIKHLELERDRSHLIVCHIGIDNEELRVLVDMNSKNALQDMSKHRGAEFEALLSADLPNKAYGNL